MGNTLGEQANAALSEYLHIPDGRVELGIRSRYHCNNAELKPVALPGGLWLTGSVAKLEVSANTVGAALGAFGGGGSSVELSAHGIRLCISDLCPSNGGGQSSIPGPPNGKRKQGGPQKPSKSLQAHLQKLKVVLRGIDLKLQMAGHEFRFRSDAVRLHPVSSRSSWSFQLHHEGVKLQLGNKDVASIEDGGAKLRFDDSHGATIEHAARVVSRIDADDLLAVLDTVATIVALAASEAAEQKVMQDSSCNASSHHRIFVSWTEVLTELHMFGDLILRLQCRQGDAKITPTDSSVRFDPITVVPGTGADSSTAELVVQLKPGAKVKVQHGFGPQSVSSFPPWRPAVELIKTDERFNAHKSWLTAVTDGFEAEPMESGRKRSVDYVSASSDGDSKRRRE